MPRNPPLASPLLCVVALIVGSALAVSAAAAPAEPPTGRWTIIEVPEGGGAARVPGESRPSAERRPPEKPAAAAPAKPAAAAPAKPAAAPKKPPAVAPPKQPAPAPSAEAAAPAPRPFDPPLNARAVRERVRTVQASADVRSPGVRLQLEAGAVRVPGVLVRAATGASRHPAVRAGGVDIGASWRWTAHSRLGVRLGAAFSATADGNWSGSQFQRGEPRYGQVDVSLWSLAATWAFAVPVRPGLDVLLRADLGLTAVAGDVTYTELLPTCQPGEADTCAHWQQVGRSNIDWPSRVLPTVRATVGVHYAVGPIGLLLDAGWRDALWLGAGVAFSP